MWGAWFFSTARAVEQALREGRLDDAWRQLSDASSDTAPLQAARSQLAEKLLARARLHALAARHRDALADLERVLRLAPGYGEAISLQERVAREALELEQRASHQANAQHQAEKLLVEGRIESGRAAIARIADAAARERLHQQLDVRERGALQIAERIREALSKSDLLLACICWSDAMRRYGVTPALDAVASELAETARNQVVEQFRGGALEAVAALLQASEVLPTMSPHVPSLRARLQQSRAAASALEAGDLRSAQAALLRVAAQAPGVAWVDAALSDLRVALDAQARLLASPLGQLVSPLPGAAPMPGQPGAAETSQMPSPAAQLGHPLLLIVDGVGSALLLTGAHVRLGRVGAPVDVQIPANVQSHHADISLSGDDYVLAARGPVHVNGQPVHRTRLHHGDRVTLGAGARFTFLRPSAKSDTAVLRLSDRCRLADDVSFVVLMRETLVIGPHVGAHLPALELNDRVVLFDRDGRLMARRGTAHARRGEGVALIPNQPAEVGELRLTVRELPDGAQRA